jgi:hypothetical protein
MDEKADNIRENPQIKKGQFLWKDEMSQKKYLTLLKKKIAGGYFYSDRVISRVVEEIAPVFREIAEFENNSN